MPVGPATRACRGSLWTSSGQPGPIPLGNVRGVGYQQFDLPGHVAGERIEQVALIPLDPQIIGNAIARRQVQGIGGDIGADDPRSRKHSFEGESQGTRTGTEVNHKGRRPPAADQLEEILRLGAGNEHPMIDANLDRPEGHGSFEILEGLTFQPAVGQRIEFSLLGGA